MGTLDNLVVFKFKTFLAETLQAWSWCLVWCWSVHLLISKRHGLWMEKHLNLPACKQCKGDEGTRYFISVYQYTGCLWIITLSINPVEHVALPGYVTCHVIQLMCCIQLSQAVAKHLPRCYPVTWDGPSPKVPTLPSQSALLEAIEAAANASLFYQVVTSGTLVHPNSYTNSWNIWIHIWKKHMNS